MCGYVYTSAGVSESTSDLVFSGHDIIADNGTIISESEILEEEHILYGEIDLEKCRSERLKFHTAMQIQDSCTYTEVTIRTAPITQPLQLMRDISPYPFVPGEEAQRSKRCMQILHMQLPDSRMTEVKKSREIGDGRHGAPGTFYFSNCIY